MEMIFIFIFLSPCGTVSFSFPDLGMNGNLAFRRLSFDTLVFVYALTFITKGNYLPSSSMSTPLAESLSSSLMYTHVKYYNMIFLLSNSSKNAGEWPSKSTKRLVHLACTV